MELKMTNGMQYWLLCKVTFHNVNGLALEIQDAVPQFNPGEMESLVFNSTRGGYSYATEGEEKENTVFNQVL